MEKKIILVILVIFLVSNSFIPVVGAISKTQQKSFQLNTQQENKNTDPADRVFIKIFTAYFYSDHGSPYPVLCAIKIDGIFRGFSWKIGWMLDDFLSFYWSGFVLVGAHTLTVTTIILIEGFVRITESTNVDADTKFINFWINLW